MPSQGQIKKKTTTNTCVRAREGRGRNKNFLLCVVGQKAKKKMIVMEIINIYYIYRYIEITQDLQQIIKPQSLKSSKFEARSGNNNNNINNAPIDEDVDIMESIPRSSSSSLSSSSSSSQHLNRSVSSPLRGFIPRQNSPLASPLPMPSAQRSASAGFMVNFVLLVYFFYVPPQCPSPKEES